MNELIVVEKRNIGGSEVNSVIGTDLHKGLESKQQYGDWVNKKLVKNRFFRINQDYCLLHNFMKQKGRGGHNRKDFIMTIDTAKKIAMAEQTSRGEMFREYFLEVERRYIAEHSQGSRLMSGQQVNMEQLMDQHIAGLTDKKKADMVGGVVSAMLLELLDSRRQMQGFKGWIDTATSKIAMLEGSVGSFTSLTENMSRNMSALYSRQDAIDGQQASAIVPTPKPKKTYKKRVYKKRTVDELSKDDITRKKVGDVINSIAHRAEVGFIHAWSWVYNELEARGYGYEISPWTQAGISKVEQVARQGGINHLLECALYVQANIFEKYPA